MRVTFEAYKEFWNLLPTNVEANLKFAKEVAAGDSMHQYYFFGEYSKPILSWIIVHALYKSYTTNAERAITGQYYEFVAGPFKECIPQWAQLKWYKGINNEKLHSWLKRNGCQWFRKDKNKEEKEWGKLSELLEFKDYGALNDVEDNDYLSDEQLVKEQRLQTAWGMLSDKDQEVLTLMVIKELHWSESWEALNKHIHPRAGREVMLTWTPKRKQDAMALLKERAIEHLEARYKILK